MSDKPLSQRLQIKPGRSFCLINEPDGYLNAIKPLPEGSKFVAAGEKAEVVQVFVTGMEDFKSRLPAAIDALTPGGILWVTYPKLTSKLAADINRDTIWKYIVALGWQAVAIISVDETWTALRMKRS